MTLLDREYSVNEYIFESIEYLNNAILNLCLREIKYPERLNLRHVNIHKINVMPCFGINMATVENENIITIKISEREKILSYMSRIWKSITFNPISGKRRENEFPFPRSILFSFSISKVVAETKPVNRRTTTGAKRCLIVPVRLSECCFSLGSLLPLATPVPPRVLVLAVILLLYSSQLCFHFLSLLSQCSCYLSTYVIFRIRWKLRDAPVCTPAKSLCTNNFLIIHTHIHVYMYKHTIHVFSVCLLIITLSKKNRITVFFLLW